MPFLVEVTCVTGHGPDVWYSGIPARKKKDHDEVKIL
jgi:hypothetical protein